MLRLRASALRAALALAALAAGAGPAHAVAVSAGSGSGLAGQTVDIDINTASLTGLNVLSLQFNLSYNNNLVTAVSVITTGTLTAGWEAPVFNVTNVGSTGKISVSAAGTGPLTGAGSLLKVRFTINPAQLNANSTTLTLANFIFNEGTPTVTMSNGTLTINATPQIDVSPDVGVVVRGQTLQFTASGSVTNPVTWSTSNNVLATISGTGLLTGVAPGSVTVTALDAALHSATTTGTIDIRGMGLSVGPASVLVGQSVSVPVTTTTLNGLGIRSGQFSLTFPANYFTVTGVTTPAGTLLNGWGPVTFSAQSGGCTVDFAGSTDLTGSGVLCYLTFAASPTLSGAIGVSFTSALFNEIYPAKTTNGTVTITPLPSIIVNPDQVTLLAGQTQQMTLGGSPTNPIQWSVVDPFVASISATGLVTALHGGVTQVRAQDFVGAIDYSTSLTVFDLKATLGTVTGRPGTTIRVPLTSDRLVGGLGIWSEQFKVSWTGTSILAARAVSSGLWGEWGPVQYTTTPTSITTAAAGSATLDNGGLDLAAIEVDIAPGAPVPSDILLTISGLILNEGHPTPQTVNGSVHVRSTAGVTPSAAVFALGEGAPNPLRGFSRIPFTLPASESGGGRVTLGVYSLDGRHVRTLLDAALDAGPHEATWDGRDDAGRAVRAGLYFYRLAWNGQVLARKLAVVR